jgi:hypothetical protein
MPTYKFEQFNIEIVNPTIEINPVVKEVNPINMSISVDIVLVTPNGSKFGVNLSDVLVENLNYDAITLEERVMTKLEEYIV